MGKKITQEQNRAVSLKEVPLLEDSFIITVLHSDNTEHILFWITLWYKSDTGMLLYFC